MMMRRLSLTISVLLLASLAAGQTPTPPSEVEKLKVKAESMKDHDRGKIYSEIARELAEEANRQFTQGQVDEALASVKMVVDFAEKASAAAKLKNKKTKDTEINLRKTARRLEEVGKTLAVEDRPPIEAAVERLDAIRKDLLEYFLKRG